MTAVQVAVGKLPFAGSKAAPSGFELVGSATISPEMVADFARATGDYNPIHFEDKRAQSQGFEGAIAHAGLITGYVSSVMFETFGAGTVVNSIGLTRLEKPVPVGKDISVYMRTRRNRERRGTTFIKVDVQVRCENEVVVIMNDVSMIRP